MRYLLFFIRSVFYFFIFLRNFYHQSKWKSGICSDSHHTPHTVYAIDFLIWVMIDSIWLQLIDSVNEQSKYLLFFMWFFDFFYLSFFIICLFICLFFLSQNFSTEKNDTSEWKLSICFDCYHTPHSVYVIDFLIGIMIDCI